jgi:hypothetical protein
LRNQAPIGDKEPIDDRVPLPSTITHKKKSGEEEMNDRNNEADKMVKTMEAIAENLEKVVAWLSTCAGLLALIAFTIILRTLIGR